MLNRVTNLTMSTTAQRTLQAQQSKLAQLQEKATTLDKISRPSATIAAAVSSHEDSIPRIRTLMMFQKQC